MRWWLCNYPAGSEVRATGKGLREEHAEDTRTAADTGSLMGPGCRQRSVATSTFHQSSFALKTCQLKRIYWPFSDIFLWWLCYHMEMSSPKQYRCKIKVWTSFSFFVHLLLPHIKCICIVFLGNSWKIILPVCLCRQKAPESSTVSLSFDPKLASWWPAIGKATGGHGENPRQVQTGILLLSLRTDNNLGCWVRLHNFSLDC